MVKLSVSRAARILGISRFDIQEQINNGKLQTHEGYVTMDSLRLTYPNVNLNSEQDKHIQKMQRIKDNAASKAGAINIVQTENKKAFGNIIAGLKTKLYKEQIKNQHYEMIFAELNERLDVLEKCCHAQDKTELHKLQGWIKQQFH